VRLFLMNIKSLCILYFLINANMHFNFLINTIMEFTDKTNFNENDS
jgi:hypothetical protein